MRSDLRKCRVDPPRVGRYIPLRSERSTRPDGETGRGARAQAEGRKTGTQGPRDWTAGGDVGGSGPGVTGSRPAVRPQGHAAGRASHAGEGRKAGTGDPPGTPRGEPGGVRRRGVWRRSRGRTCTPQPDAQRRQRRSAAGGDEGRIRSPRGERPAGSGSSPSSVARIARSIRARGADGGRTLRREANRRVPRVLLCRGVLPPGVVAPGVPSHPVAFAGAHA